MPGGSAGATPYTMALGSLAGPTLLLYLALLDPLLELGVVLQGDSGVLNSAKCIDVEYSGKHSRRVLEREHVARLVHEDLALAFQHNEEFDNAVEILNDALAT